MRTITTIDTKLIIALTDAINNTVSMRNPENNGTCKAGILKITVKTSTVAEVNTHSISYNWYYDSSTSIAVCKKTSDSEAVTHRFKNTHKAEGLIIY